MPDFFFLIFIKPILCLTSSILLNDETSLEKVYHSFIKRNFLVNWDGGVLIKDIRFELHSIVELTGLDTNFKK